MAYEECEKSNRAPIEILKILPEYQGRTGRHKCVICAYEFGMNERKKKTKYKKEELETCKHGNRAPTSVLEKIHLNQGGTGRHKCATCAYTIGNNLDITTSQPIKKEPDKSFLEVTEPPKFEIKKKPIGKKKPSKIDYKKSDEIKVEIGMAGEEAVLDYEKEFLIKCGMKKLAMKVEHISKTKGDGEGYDILSFNPDGEKKYIEVKTTTQKKSTQFFISSNELEFQENNIDNYWLYRVYEFDKKTKKGKMFMIKGEIEDHCELKPCNYVGTFN